MQRENGADRSSRNNPFGPPLGNQDERNWTISFAWLTGAIWILTMQQLLHNVSKKRNVRNNARPPLETDKQQPFCRELLAVHPQLRNMR